MAWWRRSSTPSDDQAGEAGGPGGRAVAERPEVDPPRAPEPPRPVPARPERPPVPTPWLRPAGDVGGDPRRSVPGGPGPDVAAPRSGMWYFVPGDGPGPAGQGGAPAGLPPVGPGPVPGGPPPALVRPPYAVSAAPLFVPPAPEAPPTAPRAPAVALVAAVMEPEVATTDHTGALAEAMQIDGALGAALVDSGSGMALATAGGPVGIDLDIAAAGNSSVIHAARRTLTDLSLQQSIEDVLITLEKQFHVIRPLARQDGFFLYLVLDRARANLGMARFRLASIERNLRL